MRKKLITCMLAFAMLFTAMPVNAAGDLEAAELFTSSQGEEQISAEGNSGYVTEFEDGSSVGFTPESGGGGIY